jgi:hypothetical protein
MNVTNITPKSKKKSNLATLQQYLAECASVVRDKAPKSAEKLWDRLLTESLGEPSRVFEFIPCKIDYNRVDMGISQLFGFRDKKYYYTNARELLSWGYTMDDVLSTVDFTNYVVFKCEAPYFIYGQISTHTQLSTISHSQRYADCDRGYWKPKEVNIPQTKWDIGVGDRWRRWELRDVMKKAGITRKEVFDRGSDMLQYRVFTIGGYTNNPNAWEHFIKLRTDKHAQKETQEFVGLFKKDLGYA